MAKSKTTKEYAGLGGAMSANRKSGLSPIQGIKPLRVQPTQNQARVMNNSTFNATPTNNYQTRGVIHSSEGSQQFSKGLPQPKVQYDDLPKQNIQSLKKGGMVKRTGLAYLHKGEKVIPKSQLNKLATKHMFNSKRSS